MNIHGGVSARCFITPSLRALPSPPFSSPPPAPVPTALARGLRLGSTSRPLLLLRPRLLIRQRRRRVNQYATPRTALCLSSAQFLTLREIYSAGRAGSANIFSDSCRVAVVMIFRRIDAPIRTD